MLLHRTARRVAVLVAMASGTLTSCAAGSDDAGGVIIYAEGGAAAGGVGAAGGAGGGSGGSAGAGTGAGSGAGGGGTGSGGTGTECSGGRKVCGGICVEPAPQNGCAATDCAPCAAPPANSTAACAGGGCGYVCNPGFAPTGAGCQPGGAGGAGSGGSGAGGSGGGPGICASLCAKGTPLGCPGNDEAKCNSECSVLWSKFPACGSTLDAFYACASAQPLTSFECDPVDQEPVLRAQFCGSEAFALAACVS